MISINHKKLGLILGPLYFVVIFYFLPLEGLSQSGRGALACTTWLAIWWMTEAIPIEATALLPIIIFPLSGTVDIKSATFPYANSIVFLFLGGFIIALAIERWHLHRRIALTIIQFIGTNPQKVILGFMVATGFLSMWISNTATTLMMVPIGLSVISNLKHDGQFSKSLLLGIAYSASIGGMATLIGTPPNVVFAAVVKETFNVEIGFVDWMMIGLPFSILMIYLSWLILTKVIFKIGKGGSEDFGIEEKIAELGKITIQEKRVFIVFILTAFCWITKNLFIKSFIPAIDDTIIAVIGGLSLFIIPDNQGGKLMTWNQMNKMPWGILLLFGGGLSIASAFVETDLASWIGEGLHQLNTLPIILLVLVVALFVNFLTEVTSNVATASMILPIMAALAVSINLHPYYLMISAILASSCAFMLPIATPPNAIVFGNEHVQMKDMIKAGVALNFLSVILIAIVVMTLMPLVWDLDLSIIQP